MTPQIVMLNASAFIWLNELMHWTPNGFYTYVGGRWHGPARNLEHLALIAAAA